MPFEDYNNASYEGIPVSTLKTKKPTIATPCTEYEEMAERWELPEALMGGTLKMRKEGEKWLPRHFMEPYVQYRARLASTTLFNTYKRTLTTLAGLPFIVPATVESVPDNLLYLQEDCDSFGGDLTDIGNNALQHMIHYGIAHILVDNPNVDRAVSSGDIERYRLRPYFSLINPTNLISWSYKRVGGLTTLSEIRIKEQMFVKDGFGDKEVNQIHVITPNVHEYWQEVKKDQWEKVDEVPNELGYIPLVTIYGARSGFMTAEPTLEDLAWLTLRHYQKQSSLDTIIHMCESPFLFGKMLDKDSMNDAGIGPNTVVIAGDPDAELNYVSPDGTSIQFSETSIKNLEERMAAMGADLIVRKSVDRQTATSRMIDQSESISQLQIMINNLETGLQQAVIIAGDWVDEDDFSPIINIGDNLDAGAGGPNYLDMLLQFLVDNKGMDIYQAANELKRRGGLSDTFDIDKIKKEQTSEGSDNVPNNEGEMPEITAGAIE